MKKILALMLCVILLTSCIFTVSAREPSKKKTYIVVLEAPAVYSPDRVSLYSADDDMYREALLELQAEVRAQIYGGVSAFSLREREQTYSYTDVLNGFTVKADAATAEKIKDIEGVAYVCEDEIIDIIRPAEVELGETPISENAIEDSSNQLSVANSGNMINVQAAYDKGYDGRGRAIAVIDTTINPNHVYYKLADDATAKYTQADIAQILQNNTMQTSATAANAYRNAKIPYAFNYPSNEPVGAGSDFHGAHVAGIAAGNSVSVSDGVIRGIAHEAQILFFGMYHPNGTYSSHIVAALEDALKFDVDAINISMGIDYVSENRNNAKELMDAVAACRNAGKTVVISAGNADRISDYAIMSDYGTSDNRSHPYSVKVGSIQAEYAYINYLEDQSGKKYPCAVKSNTMYFSSMEVVDCGSGSQAEITAAGVSGKIALISMPDAIVADSLSTYGKRAVNAGAQGVVVGYTSNDLLDGRSGYNYPMFLVSRDTAEDIRNNAQKLKFTNERTVLQREEAPRENTFSSYGYSDKLDISVDYSAPGGNIYSSYNGNNFANLSGTSMAAPHITGATSLMYQYVEDKFPSYMGVNKMKLVKNLLASTAETVYAPNGAISSPRKVGSGLIQLDRAMETSVILKGRNSDETKINLGAGLNKSFNVNFVAQNLGNTPVTFSGINVEISADDYKYYDGKGYGYSGLKKLTATVTGSTSVTVPAKSSSAVALSIALDDTEIAYLEKAMTNGFFIDGKVTLTSSTNCDVGIPFSGFYGDWSKLTIMNEKRILDFFRFYGLAEDGFSPVSLTAKNASGFIVPISDNVDETVKDARVILEANPTRNAYMSVKVDGVYIIKDAFINKEFDTGYYLGKKVLKDLSSVSVVTVELRLPYYDRGVINRSFTINMIKDNTPPVISDMYVKNDNTAYVVVSDNYGVGAVSSYGTANGHTEINDSYIGKESATASFDITEQEDVKYLVYDCAFNKISFEPHVTVDVKNGVAVFTNNTQHSLPGDCMMAVYENGKMTEFKRFSESGFVMDAYDTKEYSIEEYAEKDYKLFFWNNKNNINPLCEAYNTTE